MEIIEFVVKGRPKTLQALNRDLNRWKDKVKGAAANLGLVPTTDNDLFMDILYFYEGNTRIDTDNLSKPICDALQGVVYHNDSQVIDRRARRRDINGAFRIRGLPPRLAIAMCEESEFVFIRIGNVGARISELI